MICFVNRGNLATISLQTVFSGCLGCTSNRVDNTQQNAMLHWQYVSPRSTPRCDINTLSTHSEICYCWNYIRRAWRWPRQRADTWNMRDRNKWYGMEQRRFIRSLLTLKCNRCQNCFINRLTYLMIFIKKMRMES